MQEHERPAILTPNSSLLRLTDIQPSRATLTNTSDGMVMYLFAVVPEVAAKLATVPWKRLFNSIVNGNLRLK